MKGWEFGCFVEASTGNSLPECERIKKEKKKQREIGTPISHGTRYRGRYPVRASSCEDRYNRLRNFDLVDH